MISVAVEGESDREAARAVARAAGHEVRRISVARGKSRLDPKIAGYNRAARYENWVVFRDADGVCPVELRTELLRGPEPPSQAFALRIAESMMEAWLLADREGFARYFRVKQSRVPAEPDRVPHAKRTVLDLCAKSASTQMRNDMTSRGGRTGPLYVSVVNDFASTAWNVRAAMENERLV